jgi:hypothetical protein
VPGTRYLIHFPVAVFSSSVIPILPTVMPILPTVILNSIQDRLLRRQLSQMGSMVNPGILPDRNSGGS